MNIRQIAVAAATSALTLLTMTGTASAYLITVQVAPISAPFTLLPLGSSPGNPNAFQNSTSFTLDGETITYTQGNGGLAGVTGEYAGNPVGVAKSPFGSGDSTDNYLAAAAAGGVIPGTSSGPTAFGTVTVTYATPQTELDLLWGSVDYSPQNTLLTISPGGLDITGTDIYNAAGVDGYNLGSIFAGGTYNIWVEITGLPSFTVADAEDTTPNNAFEFVPGVPTATTVPEPATVELFGAVLAIFGWFGLLRRNPQKKSDAKVV
jgi:hypothetical protein